MAETPEIPASQSTNSSPPWSQVWQIPVLLLGLLLFGAGLYFALPQPQEDDFPGALTEVEHLLHKGNFGEAEARLKIIAQHIGRGDREQQAHHALLWGDLIYLQQIDQGGNLEENHQRIITWYEKAQKLGQTMDGDHQQRWALTLVSLGKEEEALKQVAQIKEDSAQQRYTVVKRLIERHLQQPNPDLKKLAQLIGRLQDELRQEPSAAKRRAEEIWAVQQQARATLDAGDSQGTIDYLLRRMISFKESGGEGDLAPLWVTLAKAFQRLGDRNADAQRYYKQAQQQLLPTDVLNGEILVGLAQIDLAEAGDVRSALEGFSRAELDFKKSPAYLDALIGRADCEARLGAHPEAMEHFGQAVKILTTSPNRTPAQVEQLDAIVRGHFGANFDRQKYALALDYLSLLPPLYQPELPAALLGQFALTHEKLGQQRVADGQTALAAQKEEAGPTTAPARAEASNQASYKLAVQEGAVHLSKAAEYYQRYARAVTVSDDKAYGDSLWRAAQCYDQAKLWRKAIDVYAEYVRTRPNDPRQVAAAARLGLAYQADGQYGAAAGLFARLVEEYPNSPETYESLVPLARCHVALGQHDAAKRVLLHVLTGHPSITSESQPYHDALVEISKLYYDLKEYEPAIEHLSQAVDRYGESSEGPALRFRLADAYRQSIDQIDKSMDQSLPQTKKMALQAERTRRLEQALDLYGKAIRGYEARNVESLSEVEQLCYRNAYFYRGDCAYDLGRFEQAISLYDVAAKRWENHPASLVALVQIVNAYCELGQTQEARVANDRARWQLKRIPEEAFNDPSLPMTRQHWQDWLKWTSELNLFGSQASAAAATPASDSGAH